jgi:hypothetical protein
MPGGQARTAQAPGTINVRRGPIQRIKWVCRSNPSSSKKHNHFLIICYRRRDCGSCEGGRNGFVSSFFKNITLPSLGEETQERPVLALLSKPPLVPPAAELGGNFDLRFLGCAAIGGKNAKIVDVGKISRCELISFCFPSY